MFKEKEVNFRLRNVEVSWEAMARSLVIVEFT